MPTPTPVPTTVPSLTPRGHPKVCQPWNGVQNRPDLTELEAVALHDLWWTGTWRMGLQWKVDDEQRYVGLSTTLVDIEGDPGLKVARERRDELRRLNPDLRVLISLLYREADYREDETDLRWWEIGHYPPDSPYWIRDGAGDPVPGWGEDADLDGTIEPDEILSSLLDFRNAEVIELVAQRALAVKRSGVADGVFLDWWNEHGRTAGSYLDWSIFYMTAEEELDSRLRLLRRIRELVGEDFLILLNTNERTAPLSAPLANGTFMELWKPDWSTGYTLEQVKGFEDTLSWATEAFREPRINCLEGWRVVTDYGNESAQVEERNSPENRQWMRLFTTMALTHSDETVVFGDDNAEPNWDHHHNWYPFWDADLGEPVGAKRSVLDGVDGLFVRRFTNGYAVYNRSGSLRTVRFPVDVESVADGRTGLVHDVSDMDGGIYLGTPTEDPPTLEVSDRLASHLFVPVGESRSLAGLGDLLEVVPIDGADVVVVEGRGVRAVGPGIACLRFRYRDLPGENGVQTACVVTYDEVGTCAGRERVALDLERFGDGTAGPLGNADLLASGDGSLAAVCRSDSGGIRVRDAGTHLPPLYLHVVDALTDGPYSLGDDEQDRLRASTITRADGVELAPPWVVAASWDVVEPTIVDGELDYGFRPCAESPGCSDRSDTVRRGDVLTIGPGIPWGAPARWMALPEEQIDRYVHERTGIRWAEVLERDPALPEVVLVRLANADLLADMVPWFDDLHDLRAKDVPVAYGAWVNESIMNKCRPEPENRVVCQRIEDAVEAWERSVIAGLRDDGHRLWSLVSLVLDGDGSWAAAEARHRPRPDLFDGALVRVQVAETFTGADAAAGLAAVVRQADALLPANGPVVVMGAGPPITAQTGAGGFCEAEVCPSDFDASYDQFVAWLDASMATFGERLVGVGIPMFDGSHFDIRDPIETFPRYGLNRVGETGFNHPGLNPWRVAGAVPGG